MTRVRLRDEGPDSPPRRSEPELEATTPHRACALTWVGAGEPLKANCDIRASERPPSAARTTHSHATPCRRPRVRSTNYSDTTFFSSLCARSAANFCAPQALRSLLPSVGPLGGKREEGAGSRGGGGLFAKHTRKSEYESE